MQSFIRAHSSIRVSALPFLRGGIALPVKPFHRPGALARRCVLAVKMALACAPICLVVDAIWKGAPRAR